MTNQGQTSKHERLLVDLNEMVAGLNVGDPLPPERELAEQLGVSRMTLRRAFDELRRAGLVVSRRGSGTFASRPRVDHEFRLTSFTEEMRRLGMTSQSDILSETEGLAGATYGARLKISPDEPIWRVGRLRLADEEPMAIEWLTVPRALVPEMTAADLKNQSFYQLLADRYGLTPAGGRQRLEATVTDADESELLEVALHSPALLVDRVIWASDGRVIEHVRSIYRGDRYTFSASLRAPGPLS